MAQAPSPATKSTDLPTIIIDPSAYEPERPYPVQTLYDNFIRLTRVTLAATAVGTATFGVAQVLDVDSLLPSAWVSVLTAALPQQADRVEVPGSARTQSKAEDRAGQAPVLLHALAEAPAVAPNETPQALKDTPEEPAVSVEAPGSAREQDNDVAAAAPSATAPDAPAEPRAAPPTLTAATGVSQARAQATPAKAGGKAANVQDEIRNARRLLALNRFEQAEAAYREVLALNEREPAALTGLARVQLARGQLDDALASALRAVERAPDLASAQLTLGDVLRARGDKTGAQAHYDQAAPSDSATGVAEP